MEEVLIGHSDLVEAAVVASKDDLKGELPVGFVVVKTGCKPDPAELEKDLVQKIRKIIGPIACFKVCMVVDKLPKTRSGKILRNVLKGMVDGTKYKIPPTIEDASFLPAIQEIIHKRGLGKKGHLVYTGDDMVQ